MSAAVEAMAEGARRLRAGDTAGAIDAYARAVALDPALDDGWFNLAWTQRAERRFDAALASYARAIDAGVDEPDAAHLNRAVILSEHLHDMAAARAELERAAALNPRRLETWLNLGNLHEDLGEAAPARRAYETALRLEPGRGRASARLAALDIHEGQAAAAAVALQAALRLAPAPADRAELLFALGAALDAAGDHAGAWPAFEAANWIARQLAPERYDAAAQERLVKRLIRAVPAPLVPAARTPGRARCSSSACSARARRSPSGCSGVTRRSRRRASWSWSWCRRSPRARSSPIRSCCRRWRRRGSPRCATPISPSSRGSAPARGWSPTGAPTISCTWASSKRWFRKR